MYSLDVRIIVLKIYKKVKSLRKAELLTGVSKSTIANWAKNMNPKIRKTKFIDTIKKYICELVEGNIYVTLNYIKKKLDKKFKLKCSISSIFKLLKNLKFSYKKVYQRKFNKPVDELLKLQEEFKKNIAKLDMDKIACIDETAMYQSLPPNYGWGKVGEKIVNYNKTNQKKYSVIAAISNKKMLLVKSHKKNINGELFCEFLEEFFKKNNHEYIVMDNVAFHHTKNVKNIFDKYHRIPLFIAPYSPELNPIEEIFGAIKNTYRQDETKFKFTRKFNRVINSIPASTYAGVYKRAYT